jgi:hypothetical protein
VQCIALPVLQSLPPETVLQHTVLATSLAGNAVDLLTITAAPGRGKPLEQRQGVVLSGARSPEMHAPLHPLYFGSCV